MNQIQLTKEEQEKLRDSLAGKLAERNNYYNGFLYQWRNDLTYNHTPEEREEFFWMLWKMVRLTHLIAIRSESSTDKKDKTGREAFVS